MTATYLGLVLHLVFFAIGLYLYLFARGVFSLGGGDAGARAEAFRQDNSTWMRILGLALAAIMAVNLFFDIRVLLT